MLADIARSLAHHSRHRMWRYPPPLVLCSLSPSQVGSFGSVSIKQVSLVPALALVLACGRNATWTALRRGAGSGSSSGDDDSDDSGADGGSDEGDGAAGGEAAAEFERDEVTGSIKGVLAIDGVWSFDVDEARGAALLGLRSRLLAAFQRVLAATPGGRPALLPVDAASVATLRVLLSCEAVV